MSKLALSRQAIADARRAREELVEARDRPDDFRYRFRLCVAALAAVGTTINHELGAAPTDWWRPYLPDSARLMSLRHDALKQATVSLSAVQAFADYSDTSRPRSRYRRRRRSSMTPVTTLTDSGIVTDWSKSCGHGRVFAGRPFLRWAFHAGPFAGQDPVDVIDDYLDRLEHDLLPAAEALSG